MPYEFELPFQRRLLAAAWADPVWYRLHSDVIKPEFFSDEILQGVASALDAVSKKSDGVPDLPSILEELPRHVADGRKFEEYAVSARKIKKLIGTNTAFYHEKAVDFARRAALLEAVQNSHASIQAGDLDKVQPLIQRALRVGEGGTSKYYDFLGTVGERAKEYASETSGARKHRIPSGFGPLDEACNGGLGKGEVGCFMGLPKHGKSTTLVNVGARALLSGHSVLHVSLENSISLTATKYDVRLFGKPLEKLRKLPNRFTRTLNELRSKLASKLQIVYYPTKSLTVSSLESVIEGAGAVDVVILDYGTLLKADNPRDQQFEQLVQIYEGLRRVAGECGVALWTANQANRTGVATRTLGMEHRAGCFEVAGIVDLDCSVNWDEARPAELVIHVMGSRIGKCGFSMDCSVDWETSTIKVLSDEV